MKVQKIVLVLLCFFCLACGKEEKTDEGLFKEEYESYNGQYIDLEISQNNLMKYSTVDEVNTLIQSGTGVVYIGKPDDDLSRKAVDVLIDVANNTDLETIYYLEELDGVVLGTEITEQKVPLVLFVLDGKITSYHVGTIDDKVDLSEDEVIQLYNIYMNGIHEVLQDACDERC